MSESERGNGVDSVGSVETLFDILEYVHQKDGVTLSEATSDLDYAKSTIHRHLSTLDQRGYVVNEEGYHVGLRFLELGEDARNRKQAYQLAKEKVEELAEETDERAQFLVEEHGEAVYLHRAVGDHAVRTDPGIGKRIPLHATASGKSILAAMPPEKVSRIIEQTPFEKITDETITDQDTLYDELEQIRERGYAFNREENLDGLRAIGVPVKGPKGSVIGGLSVSGPSHRFTGERFKEELPSLLLGTANELELNIAHA
ncbi:helix-turn-helix domain-containing protein [Natronomonas sp. CBA1123]|uniref:IclR family transcriptional regulator n=1 Tax=Natronomonas sp. CBA1123 TaxID=2668070 RepID=UPI0012E9A688|nr:IclR family transcriptional regulator [Natronomonas sp. CBA1123]MUV85342.1 helix-turn-helix domain-containing protein [Natronomonas sp. CBA1123]